MTTSAPATSSSAAFSSTAATAPPHLELTRAVRPWEFLSSTGRRAALLGRENGSFEAWVYPLKIFRNFALRFRVDGHVIPGEKLARTVVVRPESSTIVYAWDTFQVRETLLAPVHEQGVLVKLEIETTEPLEVDAVFERDFQLEWPASIADSDMDWMPALHAFSISANQQKYVALVGSPSATEGHVEYTTNYAASAESSMALGVTKKGRETKYVVIAASLEGRPQAEALYRRLAASYDDLLRDSAAYYRDYLERNVRLTLPDKALEQAYEWSEVAMLQGVVENPFLGTGLIAGYGASGTDQRPGYDWFFGRDALWTSLALDAEGDFGTTRTALEFLSKYQRADGKVPHEIAQGASFVPWFTELPYAYASADATPLFVIAMSEYVRRSGDVDFARQKWDNVWRAYQFLRSTYDAHGLPRNITVGHGWVEGGPLLPVKSELYQSALGVETLRALSSLAKALGKDGQVAELDRGFAEKHTQLNQAFWMADKHRYAYALGSRDEQMDAASVLATVPMWFGLLDAEKANEMIAQLAGLDHQTDWGMRILSAGDPRYDPGGYHFGTVWPLFTGWAAVGEYKYHRAFAGYSNLRANALLAFDGSLGHVTEVLSGNYNQGLATASPQQIWSSAMVVSPLLTGMLGLDTDAAAHRVMLSPHLPADWENVRVEHIDAGAGCSLDVEWRRDAEAMTLEARNRKNGVCDVEYAPAVSLRGHVLAATVNGKALPFHVEANANDQHAAVRFSVAGGASGTGATTVVLRVRGDFGFAEASSLPGLGSRSHGLRLLAEKWSADRETLTLEIAGAAKEHYALELWHGERVTSVEGGSLVNGGGGRRLIGIAMGDGDEGAELRSAVVIHFARDWPPGRDWPSRR